MKAEVKIQYKNWSIYVYELGIFLLSFSTIIRKSLLNEYTEWMSCFTYLSWLCMLFRLFYIKHSYKSFFLQVIMIFLATTVFSSVRTLGVATFFLKLFSSEDIQEEKTIKVAMFAFGWGFIIVIICSLLKIIPISYGISGNYTFGFGNINTLTSSICMLVIMHLYLHYNTLRNVKIIIVMIINTLLLILTESRASCLGIYFILIIAFGLINFHKTKCWIKLVSMGVFLCTIFLTVSTLFYNQFPILMKLNDSLTGRLFQAHYYLMKYPPTLFGNVILELNSSGWHWLLDMGIINMIEVTGILFSGLFIFLMFGSIHKRIDQEDYASILFLLYIQMHLLVEPFFMDMNMNMAPVFFTSFLLKKKTPNGNIKKIMHRIYKYKYR